MLLFSGVLLFLDGSVFYGFFGRSNPVWVVFGIALAGMVALPVLLFRGWFHIYSKEAHFRGLIPAAGLGAGIAVPIILVDLAVTFPADMNVHFPESLLFYPVMGFVVEIVFHLIPLTVLLVMLTAVFPKLTFARIIWPCILLVAVGEPVFQTFLGFSHPYPSWVVGYVAIHIFLINLGQLWIFKCYDLLSMFTFRLTYYLIWHIGWGYIRLELLF